MLTMFYPVQKDLIVFLNMFSALSADRAKPDSLKPLLCCKDGRAEFEHQSCGFVHRNSFPVKISGNESIVHTHQNDLVLLVACRTQIGKLPGGVANKATFGTLAI